MNEFPKPESLNDLVIETGKAGKAMSRADDKEFDQIRRDALRKEISLRVPEGTNRKEKTESLKEKLRIEKNLENKANIIYLDLKTLEQDKEDLLIKKFNHQRDTSGKQESVDYQRQAYFSELLSIIESNKKSLLENPQTSQAFRMAEMQLRQESLLKTGHIQTPYFEEEYEWLVKESVSRNPILLSGPTGTGKTEMARAFTREFVGEDPIEVRGHENTRMEEFTGKTELRASNNTKVEDLLKKWNEARELSDKIIKEKDLKSQKDRDKVFEDSLLFVGNTIGVTTETYKSLGAIGQVLDQARRCGTGVLIIDEINRIPADVVGGGLKGYYHELKKAGVLVIGTANQKDQRHKAVRELEPQEKREYKEHKFGYMPVSDLYELSLIKLLDGKGGIRANKDELNIILKRFTDAVGKVQEGYVGKLQTAYGQSDSGLKQASLNGTVIEQGKVLEWLSGYNESGQSLYDFLSGRVSDYLDNLHDGTKELGEDKNVIANIFASYGFDVPTSLGETVSKGIDEVKGLYGGEAKSSNTILSRSTIAGIDPYKVRPVGDKPQAIPEAVRNLLKPEKGEVMLDFLERDLELSLKVMRKSGLLEKLSTGAEGIKAIDGKEYHFPTDIEVSERLEAKREIILKKLEQYQNPKIVITPIGKPILDIAEAWKKIINEYKDKLHNADGSKVEVKEKYDMTKGLLENNGTPVWIWGKYADNNNVIYDPVAFNADSKVNKGKNKTEILSQMGGYSVILMEDQDVPRESVVVSVNGRTPLQTNKNAHDYLSAILTDPQYTGESGHYPEEEMMYAMAKLIENDGLVVDNYSNPKSSSVFCLGAFVPASGNVPSAFWYSDVRRAYLVRNVPDIRGGNLGARSSVRL